MSEVRYLIEDEDKDVILQGMRKYLENKQELDKLLEKLITPLIRDKELKILDACCGIGHIISSLKKISPQSEFVGIDQKDYLIKEAKNICDADFRVMDLYKLSEHFGKDFDITISWKTLSWLPDYKKAIEEMMKVTKGCIFVSSLFYEGDIDFGIKVREYQREAGKKSFNCFYNVYSLPRFKQFCLDLGAKDIEVHDFSMPFDLPKPDPNQMGTYTLKLENGQRVQVSGVVLMNWKVLKLIL